MWFIVYLFDDKLSDSAKENKLWNIHESTFNSYYLYVY